MSKTETVLAELLNMNAITEQSGLTAKEMNEIVGFNAAAKLSELKARSLVATSFKGVLNTYWLTKNGIEKANGLLTGANEPDPEEAPVIEQNTQVESSNGQANSANENNDVDNATLTNEGTSKANLGDVAGLSIPTTDTNYESDLSRENATLRNDLEHEKNRVKALEQNARELNSRIAALESHQDLVSEEGLLEQIADLELKLASIKGADTFYTVNTGTTVLTFNDEEKAIESAHNEAQRNNTESTVEKIYRVKFGIARPVKSTVWEVF